MPKINVSWLRRHRRLLSRLMVAVGLGVACIVLFMPSLIAPWSRLHNEEQELDLFSGRARYSRYFLYCRMSQEVRETPLSEALAACTRSEEGEQWVMVNIFQPRLRHSPHFTYHGALAETRAMAQFWEMYKFDAGARAKSAQQLLGVMREGGSDSAVKPYYERLIECLPSQDSDRLITADDIPDDLADRGLAP